MIGFKFSTLDPLFGPWALFSAARSTYLCYLLTDFHNIRVILVFFDDADFICDAKNAIMYAYYQHFGKNYQILATQIAETYVMFVNPITFM